MMDRIVMEVSRYRPEIESAPTFQAYEVPLTREWAVLDGLTYIKDHLDGTLSFRWSCRMGICGSSGMTINGDPKLACATFLADYLPGPVRVEPMRNFPVIRDLVVDISDFMAKLPSVKPWLVRHDEPPVEDGEYRQTPAELDAFKQFSMCINCMLCYSACPVYALDPDFLGPAAIALGQRYNLDSRDQCAADRRDVLAAADGAWACTLVGECSTACPKGVDPAGAIQRYKLTAATHALKKLLFPWGGGRMSAYRQPVERYWWARRRSYLRFMLREISCIFVAWFVLYLVLVLRAVGAGGNSYQRFLDFSANPVVVVLNVVALSFLLLHAVTWFGSAPRAMVIQVRGRRVPARAVLAGHYAAWLVVSVIVAWMVLS